MAAALSILCCSGNMGNSPTNDTLSSWIPPKGLNPSTGLVFDIILVGMQEATFKVKKKLDAGVVDADEIVDIDIDIDIPPPSPPRPQNPDPTTRRKSVLKTIKKQASQAIGVTHNKLNQISKNIATSYDSSENKFMKKSFNQIPAQDSKLLEGAISSILGNSYVPTVRHQRGEMRLHLYTTKDISAKLTGVWLATENTGIASLLANKGGIAARIEIEDRLSLSFISCHLEAHEGNQHYLGRISNLEEILEGTKIPPCLNLLDTTQISHHSFLMGDLNFRTDFGETANNQKNEDNGEAHQAHQANLTKAFGFIEKEDFAGLARFDELDRMLENSEGLVGGWKSIPPTFAPTFKVQKNVAGTTYNKQRVPSFTDRVLYKSIDNLNNLLGVLSFDSCPEFTSSDHKPVKASFEINNVDAHRVIKPSPPSKQFGLSSSSSKEPLKLTFSNIKCEGLTAMDPAIMGGKSDGFVQFSSISPRFMELPASRKRGTFKRRKHWPKTSTIENELDPVWAGEEVVVKLRVNTDAELEGKFLVLTVFDEDNLSANDVIGSVLLNCGRFGGTEKEKEKEAVEFEDLVLVRNGMPQGKISFTVKIDWPLENDGELSRFSTFRNSVSSVGGGGGEGGCCCVVQ